MNIALLAVVFAVLVGLALLAKMVGGAAGSKADTYYARKSLFTPAERSFLGVLESQLPTGVRVFGKVRLVDIMGVKSGFNRSERQAARNRINRKHVDFLLVRASDLAPLAGVELDDSSHEEEDRQQRDAFVDSVFASAGLPLLHHPVQKAYSPAEVRNRIAELLKASA
jgi:very-short-patch-repair endonuclease